MVNNDFTVVFSNPTFNQTGGGSGKSADVPMSDFTRSSDFNSATTFNFTIEDEDISLVYVNETDDTNNQFQLNSTFVITDTTKSNIWGRGYVLKKRILTDDQGRKTLRVEGIGPMGVLLRTLCVDPSGNDIWTLETSSEPVTNVPLIATSNFGSFQGDTLWPDPTDAVGAKLYLNADDDESGNEDVLDHNIGNGTYAIDSAIVATKTFATTDNVADEFIDNETFVVSGSAGGDNDGTYTINGDATWNGSITQIVVDETITTNETAGNGTGNILNKTIALTTGNNNFIPRGWAEIGTEFLYFDGYDNAAADGLYRLRNVVRGELDTTAAAHLSGADVFEKAAKQIAPSVISLDNNKAAAGFKKMRRGKDFDVEPQLGCFVLAQSATGTYQGTYKVYDEDKSLNAGSTVISVADIIKQILKGPLANGGPGFANGDINFDAATDDLLINRYDYDPKKKPKYAFEAIQDLLRQVGLTDQVNFWYRHDTGKFRLRLMDNGSSVFTVPFVNDIEREQDFEDVYTAVRVQYSDEQKLNRVSAAFAWHQEPTGVGIIPDRYFSADSDSESWEFHGITTSHPSAGNGGMEFIADGKPGSKLAMEFDDSPGGTDVEFGHVWFGAGDSPPLIDLDEIEIKVNNYRRTDPDYQPFVNTDFTWVMRLQGATDYNSSTNSGTFVDLGCEMEGVPDKSGKWVKGTWTSFLVRRVNAVRILWDYMPGTKDHFFRVHYGVVHELRITGSTTKYVLIQLTDQVTDIGDATKVYAPGSFEKLRGGLLSSGSPGAQRVLHYQLGAASDGAAVSLGRNMLKRKLSQFEQRFYKYEGLLLTVPELGLTVAIDETGDGSPDYTGVVQEFTTIVTAEGIITRGTVLNYDESVIE